RENSENKTHPVKEKIANELGLYDMSGNVLEWCSDWLANYSSLAQLNPQGPSSSSMHVTRGGSWHNDDRDCHVANRYNKSCDFFSSDDRRCDIGFRLAISLQ
ncbi:MAG: SUMF1/EgtB/PvdO family nonheme iron enzyme, partial [Bacteroidales bacterium]|nr:SUMF1/EgtB/PvdO family nonheme iron enzyme [Bacteroidales bacterium]